MKFHLKKANRFLPGAAVLSILAAGCGGGGSSGPTSPAPTPTPTPAPTSCSMTYEPNYVASVDLLRWSLFPLRVFFVRDAEYTLEKQQLATAGFNRWVAATDNGADYTVVTSASQANVTVRFYDFVGGDNGTLGTTNVTFTPSDNVIRSAELRLGITGTDSTDIATAAHEYGHTLGISGHSPNRRDLMHEFGNASGQITQSDLNTILTAYCGQFNRNANARSQRTDEPTRTISMH